MSTFAKERPKKKTKIDYTMGGKIKIKDTFEARNRPSFEEWNRNLHTSELVYMKHPDAKPKADRIMEKVGIKVDCRTLWEFLTGVEIEESVNYVPDHIATTK